MDLAEILDATQPVEVEFAGKTIVCHVYTAGYTRLHREERAELDVIREQAEPIQEQLKTLEAELKALDDSKNEQVAELKLQLSAARRESDRLTIEMARCMIPVMVQSWEMDGEPLQYNGPCPPTTENMMRVPDMLLIAVSGKAGEVWIGPMSGEPSLNGSPLEEKPDEIQTGNTTH